MAYTAHHGAVAPTSANRLSTLLNEFSARLQRYRKFRQTLGELNALNDAALTDLGLNRSMIRRVAYEAAYEH
ncbi:DUF1127 domain-containing protein [Shimia abyssi]|uniref:Uncharacterized protein YjiS (DUF1127 family) n=1 Tax=Shimia abyssi TaxID=1662395 RepID=A0A2P8FKU9_9RHOB|nr:DUF1127 domain-containing protein [Shimia abyssi]PSL22338.1 uncharacterized protein YjiS (DUF1127 family) [Shimia abyssi]